MKLSQTVERPESLATKEDSPTDSCKTDEWLTTDQAARYLGLSPASLRNMTSNGQIPYYKLGKRNRYRLPELRELLLLTRKGEAYGI